MGPSAGVALAPGRVPLTWSRFRYPQSLYKYGAVLGALTFIAYALDYLNIPLERLPGMLGRMGEMLGRRYFPPNVEHIMNAEYWHSVVETLQMSLRSLGYGIEKSGSYDSETMAVVAAFQRHHRPAKVDGIADVSTVATLGALLAAREPRTNGILKKAVA